MELKTSTLFAAFASSILVVQVLSLPMGTQDNSDMDEVSADKRPKYMDTRDLSYFKELLLLGLDELIQDGKVSPAVLEEPSTQEIGKASKRGKYLGMCVQVTPSGSYRARPCWKGHARR